MPERNLWVQPFGVEENAALRMFCFPHAGAGAQSFRTWPSQLPRGLEVLAIRLPGREMRLRDAPMTDVRDLIGAMGPALAPYLDRPFVLFGHSLGALVAFELARYFRQEFGKVPARLIVSGRVAPPDPILRAPLNALPEADFIEGLRHLGGTPKEILNDAALMQQVGPMLRGDLAMHENYVYQDGEALACDILAFGGLGDPEANRSALNNWRGMTTGSFALRMVPGDHFYIQSAESLFLRLLAVELYGVIREAQAENGRSDRATHPAVKGSPPPGAQSALARP